MTMDVWLPVLRQMRYRQALGGVHRIPHQADGVKEDERNEIERTMRSMDD